MPRKPGKTSPAKRSAIAAPFVRLPKSSRVVTARVLRARVSDKRGQTPRREVPEVRLSGAWLARVGFPKGRRYLISADRAFETIYLQADPKQRRRG